MLSYDEVGKHNQKSDCWVIVHGKVYDVTSFLDQHPGGSAIILKYAGKDATKAFDPIHPSDTLTKYLPQEFHLGPVDPNTKRKKAKGSANAKESTSKTESVKANVPLPENGSVVDAYDVEYDEQENKLPIPVSAADEDATPQGEFENDDDDDDDPPSEEELQRRKMVSLKPDLGQIYNLHDFEFVARETMERTAWAYYSSGADDEIALRNNHLAYQKVFFKPKVLVDVSSIDLSTTMLGTATSVPFYITATALGKLGHPDGEKVLTRAAARQDVIQMIPTLASCSFDEIVDQADGKQTQWFQLYVNSDRQVTEDLVRHAEKRGVKGLFITVDAPQLGRREKDMRSKNVEDLSHVQGDGEDVDRSHGAARAISSFIDTSLNWEDLKWFRSITKMPIVLKGVQSVEDTLKAIDFGVDGVVLSNHGGRQLDSVKAPIEILAELNPILKKRGLLGKLEIFIDGGVRRGSDVLKAIALGAKGVGIGRPFLYAMSTYGDDGVFKAVQVLKDEMVMNMRLLGAPSIAHLDDSYVDTADLHRQLPEDKLFSNVYQPLENPAFKSKL
ncbi:putative cytochrome b2 [Clavispora lusitaniae]|uniref:L-lactate dehydrogenase (cytochrome) n=1 Tax=Clavispora lusitaniae TaxID=36911 RepID=A0AA91Q5U0_CLALS|nr:putative cytochrome b2 [Clavispora lusitaniae]